MPKLSNISPSLNVNDMTNKMKKTKTDYASGASAKTDSSSITENLPPVTPEEEKNAVAFKQALQPKQKPKTTKKSLTEKETPSLKEQPQSSAGVKTKGAKTQEPPNKKELTQAQTKNIKNQQANKFLANKPQADKLKSQQETEMPIEKKAKLKKDDDKKTDVKIDAAPQNNNTQTTTAPSSNKEIQQVKTEQVAQVIQKASARVLLARGDGASDVRLRLDLNDSLLPDTHLVAEKSADGGLSLTFTSDNPETQSLLQTLESGLKQHLVQTQNLPIHISANNSDGQIFLQADATPQSNEQNFSNPQDKKPDWESVEDRLKENE